jgi:hypothetical protein
VVERLKILEHHADRVKYWDFPELNPLEAARKRVNLWNTPIVRKLERIYPETHGFIKAVARIIEAHRNGEEIELLDDFNGDRSLDPMCRECKFCSNPVRDLQYRLPGLEKI